MSLLALSRFVHSALVAGSVTLRDPHSFPTRRSSDLGFHKGILEFIKPYECRPQWVVCCLVLTHANPLDHDCYRDRKSTRLNSSHVAISYAVFCLTKKQTRERGPRQR